jgi:protein TonB
MELKKSHKANLERRQGGRFFLGLIISLSLILISFEWTTLTTKLAAVHLAPEIIFDVNEIDHIRREEIKPPAKSELPPLTPIIKPVDEDLPMPEIVWSTEVVPGTQIWTMKHCG